MAKGKKIVGKEKTTKTIKPSANSKTRQDYGKKGRK